MGRERRAAGREGERKSASPSARARNPAGFEARARADGFAEMSGKDRRETGSGAELAWLPSWMVCCPLPASDPGLARRPDRALAWISRSGLGPWATTFRWQIRIVGAADAPFQVGLPCGATGRLAMALLAREARLAGETSPSGSRAVTIRLGIVESLRLGGKSRSEGRRSARRVLREQLERLLLSIVTVHEPDLGDDLDGSKSLGPRREVGRRGRGGWHGIPILSVETEFWSAADDDVLTARLRLNPVFVEGLIRHGVPTDLRIFRAYGRDALGLDLRHLVQYRLRQIRRSLRIPWVELHAQLGPGIPSWRV